VAGWGHPAVHWIIGNPTYVGRIRWRDRLFDGVHEPLVDELTFQRAQAILRERGEDISRRRGNGADFLLSGVVRCARCGKAYVSMSARGNGGRYEYYACSGARNTDPRPAATNACPGTSSNTQSSSNSPRSTATPTSSQRREPQKAKALLRLLIQELRVDGRAQVQPTYRLVTREVCATSEKWSCRESNPGPLTSNHAFSERSLLCVFSAPAV
jgi:hypothetical protein